MRFNTIAANKINKKIYILYLFIYFIFYFNMFVQLRIFKNYFAFINFFN